MLNKKITVSIFIGIAIVLIAVIVLDTTPRTNDQTQEEGVTVLQSDFYEKNQDDTDGDGLFDWEEILWDSDIRNPDTDGDGVDDGEEITQGTHPAIPGPNDAITESHLGRIHTQLQIQDSLSINQTQSVFEQALPSILVQSDANITGEALQDSSYDLDSLSSSVAESLSTGVPEYTSQDIKTTTNTSEKQFEYIRSILDIITIEAEKLNAVANETQLLAEVITDQNPLMLERLEDNITFYNAVKSRLLLLPAPSEFSQEHVTLINNYANLALAIEEMQKIFDDPLVGLAGIERFKTLSNSNFDIYQQLGEILAELSN